jgi:glycosyltransferase involved in cell wall biosynthesis
MKSKALVIPFYNEETRLDLTMLIELVTAWEGQVFFVDDGSTDATLNLLSQIKDSKVTILKLEKNVGKSEALRLAILMVSKKLDGCFIFVADSDFSVSISEVIDFSKNVLKDSDIENYPSDMLVIYSASRLSLGLHSRIGVERHTFRYIIGIFIRWYINFIIVCPARDPQTPIKAYFINDAFLVVSSKGTQTRWFLDVEFLLRSRASGFKVYWREFQLKNWRDIPTSNYSGSLALYVLLDLFRLYKVRA